MPVRDNILWRVILKAILKNELLYINILLVLLFLVIALIPSNIVRLILGLPAVLFFPGYTLVAALFPRKGGVSGAERAIMGLGLSIAVVPLIGLALNYTPWGLRLYPILISLALFIAAASAVASFRRHDLPPDERFAFSFRFHRLAWSGVGRLKKTLYIGLVVALAGSIGIIAYAAAIPKEESFTEFYILGYGGEIYGYPSELKIGEEGRAKLGIVNREHNETSYLVEIKVAGEKDLTLGPIVLAHEEKWEQEVSFTFDRAGNKQSVEFVLHKGDMPYRQLQLLIDVME